jgi:hypothetical protein
MGCVVGKGRQIVRAVTNPRILEVRLREKVEDVRG